VYISGARDTLSRKILIGEDPEEDSGQVGEDLLFSAETLQSYRIFPSAISFKNAAICLSV
jgi:hypothetical protein